MLELKKKEYPICNFLNSHWTKRAGMTVQFTSNNKRDRPEGFYFHPDLSGCLGTARK